MYKELIISIIVVAIITAGSIVTQNNTTKSIEEISSTLTLVRDEISKEDVNQEKSKEVMEKVEREWEEKYEKMAYYTEHNELEKVNTDLVKLKANIEMKDYQTAVENLENCVFILNHIKDKSSLKIVNIF